MVTTEGRPQPIFFDLINEVMDGLLEMIFPTMEVDSKAGSGDMEMSGDSSGEIESLAEPDYSGSGYSY